MCFLAYQVTRPMNERVGWELLGQTVTIKGTKSGIILVLDPSISFEELSLSIANKFRNASSFLGSHNMGLIVRGRILDDYEFREELPKTLVGKIAYNVLIHEEEMKKHNRPWEKSEELLEQVEDESSSDELLDNLKGE